MTHQSSGHPEGPPELIRQVSRFLLPQPGLELLPLVVQVSMDSHLRLRLPPESRGGQVT